MRARPVAEAQPRVGADVEQLVPTAAKRSTAALVGDLRSAASQFRPFDDRVVAFVADLARNLRRDPDCRRNPAIAALAFWIRPANLERLRQTYAAKTETDGVVLAPRGVVFHMPPTNVDTLFVYSWLMAALAGNANVVRISPSAADGDTALVLSIIGKSLAEHPEVAATMSFVSYGHDEAITEALSDADVRVIWGGDETVRTIRRIPMNPLGIELTFADRFSMAALDAATVAALDDDALDELARQFFNDAYWFDQLGCSSPRIVFWRGTEEIAEASQQRFVKALQRRVTAEGYDAPVGAVMAKLSKSAAMAVDGTVNTVAWSNPNVTIVDQRDNAAVDRNTPGAGMFSFRRVDALGDIAPHIERRDQTLSYFGFSGDELQGLITELNGSGIDRVVPVGDALRFDHIWDGWDLLDVFGRRVTMRHTDQNGSELP